MSQTRLWYLTIWCAWLCRVVLLYKFLRIPQQVLAVPFIVFVAVPLPFDEILIDQFLTVAPCTHVNNFFNLKRLLLIIISVSDNGFWVVGPLPMIGVLATLWF